MEEPAAGTSETRENAQPLTGELFSRYKALAKETGMWLSLGGFHETCEEEKGKIYNTHAVLDANGELVATYRCYMGLLGLHSLRLPFTRPHLFNFQLKLNPRPSNIKVEISSLRSVHIFDVHPNPKPQTLNPEISSQESALFRRGHEP
jgi:hypothetical protein